MNKQKGRGVFIFLCLLPATLLLLLFIVYPTFQVFRTALYDKPNFVAEEIFIGLKYFKQLFTERKLNFVGALQNMILYVVVITLVTIVIAVFFANIMMREKIHGKSLFRVIFYIPNILSLVVVAGIFSAIYTPNGLLNAVLKGIGLKQLSQTKWLGDANVINWSIMIALIWQAIGYYMVMYMSSMSAIPEQLYEAANLEGASRNEQFFQITLPLIWNNLRTTLTFFIISTINLSFMFVQLTTEGNLGGLSNQFIVTSQDKYIWYSEKNTEQYFDLTRDPHELYDLLHSSESSKYATPLNTDKANEADDTEIQSRIVYLRGLLMNELEGRPEGFVKDGKLHPIKEPLNYLPRIKDDM